MAKTYKPKRFTDVGILKRLDFPLLIRFLERYQSFFEAKEGFEWAHDPAEFPFDALVKIMMNLDTAAPAELLETLYYIEALSDEDYYDPLLQLALEQDIRLRTDGDPTVEDLVLHLCLECPEEVEKFHTKIDCADVQKRTKRFQSYFVSEKIRPMREPTADLIQGLETDLDQWAEEHRHGLGMQVFVSREQDAVWFLIRHGQQMKRENTVTEEGGNELIFFRPEKFDVAIYYPNNGELAIKVSTKGLKIAYIQGIGRYFFHDPAYFRVDECCKYTLQPIIDRGEDSLVCLWDDVGIKKVTLCEVQIDHHDGRRSLEIWRGLDVFETLQQRRRQLGRDEDISIRRAKLKVLRADDRKHILTIEPPNIALYDRDSDHDIIHPWLVKRGFIINNIVSGEEQNDVEEFEELLAAS